MTPSERSGATAYRGWFVVALLFGSLALASRPYNKRMITSCAQQIDFKGNPVGPSCPSPEMEEASAGFYVAGLTSMALIFQGMILFAKNRNAGSKG